MGVAVAPPPLNPGKTTTERERTTSFLIVASYSNADVWRPSHFTYFSGCVSERGTAYIGTHCNVIFVGCSSHKKQESQIAWINRKLNGEYVELSPLV